MEAAARETFLRLMAEYRGALARLASAYLTEPADRDDLVQEIATAIWQAIPRFRGDASERTWLYRIAHNTAITTSARVRRRFLTEAALDVDGPSRAAGVDDRVRRRFRTEAVLDDGFSTAAGVDDRLVHEQHRALLLARIRALPEGDRQVIVMHLEGLSHGEIGEVTGATPGAIATRLSRIRERLIHELQR